jgi:hypothetical protein
MVCTFSCEPQQGPRPYQLWLLVLDARSVVGLRRWFCDVQTWSVECVLTLVIFLLCVVHFHAFSTAIPSSPFCCSNNLCEMLRDLN